MLKPNDERWRQLRGRLSDAVGSPPPTPKLEAREDLEGTWHELWDELRHHGDVGDASYVAVTEIVRIYRQHSVEYLRNRRHHRVSAWAWQES